MIYLVQQIDPAFAANQIPPDTKAADYAINEAGYLSDPAHSSVFLSDIPGKLEPGSAAGTLNAPTGPSGSTSLVAGAHDGDTLAAKIGPQNQILMTWNDNVTFNAPIWQYGQGSLILQDDGSNGTINANVAEISLGGTNETVNVTTDANDNAGITIDATANAASDRIHLDGVQIVGQSDPSANPDFGYSLASGTLSILWFSPPDHTDGEIEILNFQNGDFGIVPTIPGSGSMPSPPSAGTDNPVSGTSQTAAILRLVQAAAGLTDGGADTAISLPVNASTTSYPRLLSSHA